MALNLTSASTDLPISIEEAKQHLAIVDDDRYDSLIKNKMRAATLWCERQVRGHRKFAKASYTLKLPEFPCDNEPIQLPLPPLVSIDSIAYYDDDNASQTWSSTAYDTLIPDEQPGNVRPKETETYPSTYRRPDAVTVTFTCGYGVPRKVPDDAKEAILTMTEAAYDPTRLPMEEAKEIAKTWLEGMEYGHYA